MPPADPDKPNRPQLKAPAKPVKKKAVKKKKR